MKEFSERLLKQLEEALQNESSEYVRWVYLTVVCKTVGAGHFNATGIVQLLSAHVRIANDVFNF